jgi:hypothetical protein
MSRVVIDMLDSLRRTHASRHASNVQRLAGIALELTWFGLMTLPVHEGGARVSGTLTPPHLDDLLGIDGLMRTTRSIGSTSTVTELPVQVSSHPGRKARDGVALVTPELLGASYNERGADGFETTRLIADATFRKPTVSQQATLRAVRRNLISHTRRTATVIDSRSIRTHRVWSHARSASTRLRHAGLVDDGPTIEELCS